MAKDKASKPTGHKSQPHKAAKAAETATTATPAKTAKTATGKATSKPASNPSSKSTPADAAVAAAAPADAPAKAGKKPGKGKLSASRFKLLREIKSFGGDATDLDLLEDVLSGSEREDNADEPVVKAAAKSKKANADGDELGLLRELQAFMSGHKIDPSASRVETDDEEDDDDDEDEAEEEVEEKASEPPKTKETKKDKKKDKKEKEEKEEPVPQLVDAAASLDVLAFMDELDDETEDATRYDRKDESAVLQMISDIMKGNKPADKLKTQLVIEPMAQWWTVPLPAVDVSAVVDRTQLTEKFQSAKKMWEEEVAKYDKMRQSGSGADQDFIATVLKSGTTSDKVSALTLLIQESPLHKFAYLRDHLINGMARKKARREAMFAIDSIKDLMLNTILPDRKLKYFVDQPVHARGVTRQHLITWYFEDALKKAYFEFIQLLEELARDPLPHVKNKMLSCIFDLLVSKPEEEQNLLTLLVNKVGDLEKKIASKAAHQLSQLLLRHPAMKGIVVREVERLLFRANISERAQYYAVTFLNQIVLTKSDRDVEAANLLIDIYFRLFDVLVKRMRLKAESEDGAPAAAVVEGPKKKDRHRDRPAGAKGGPKGGKGRGGKGGKGKGGKGGKPGAPDLSAPAAVVDGVDAKMMAALLTGVNRAFPFSKMDDDVFDAHLNTLFTITHIGSFNTSIQALTLVFQVQTSRQMVSDRFYRALYSSLFDRRLHESSKQSMYLNLLYKALRADPSTNRVRSYIKRIVQVCGEAQVPLICGALFLIGELAKQRPGLWAFITQPEDHDDEEHFVDAADQDDMEVVPAVPVDDESAPTAADGGAEAAETAKSPAKVTVHNTRIYDGRKRDPLYANADQVCLWELCAFATHFHPTVSLYAQTLLSGTAITVPPGAKNYDPLQNHTLTRFLDRFVYKAPKRVTTLYHGTSLMQPRGTGTTKSADTLLAGGRRKANAVFHDTEDGGIHSAAVELDDTPVNLVQWEERTAGTVAPDEQFFFKFFKARAEAEKKSASKRPTIDDADLDSDQDIGEDEVWDAMQRSVGFPRDSVPGFEDDDDGFDLPEGSDDDDDDEEDGGFKKVGGDDGDGDDQDASDDESDGGDGPTGDAVGEGEEDFNDEMAAWAGADATGGSDKDGDDGFEDVDDDDDEEDDPVGDNADDDGEMADVLMAEEDDSDDFDDLDDEEADDTEGKGKGKGRKRGQSMRDKMMSKAASMGYSGDYFTKGFGEGDFASADDFAKLIDAGQDADGHDDDNDDGEEETGKRSRGGRRGGRGGRGAGGESRKRKFGSGVGAGGDRSKGDRGGKRRRH